MMRWMEGLLSVLFPQRNLCHACGAPLVAGEGLLCESCERSLAACSLLPAHCETVMDPSIAFAASAYVYEGTAAALVKALKFGANQTASIPLADGLAAVYAMFPEFQTASFCVAVPVHYLRLRKRGYNQSEILADALSARVGLPVVTDVLLRVHHKRSQVGQGREARRLNIAGAFATSTHGRSMLRGHTVLLLDDVLTTGSTAIECAQALMKAGAARVLLLTACRA